MLVMIQLTILEMKNAILHAKIDELKTCKPSTSTVEHVVFVRDVETLMLMLFMIT
jgi:hypothetical protein